MYYAVDYTNWFDNHHTLCFGSALTLLISFTLSRFSRPILHGLCTFGIAARAIIKCVCRGNPDMVKNISGRLLLHVYPGETLITEMWLDSSRYILSSATFDEVNSV